MKKTGIEAAKNCKNGGVIPLLCGIETSRKGYLTSKNDGFAFNMFGVMWFKQKKFE